MTLNSKTLTVLSCVISNEQDGEQDTFKMLPQISLR